MDEDWRRPCDHIVRVVGFDGEVVHDGGRDAGLRGLDCGAFSGTREEPMPRAQVVGVGPGPGGFVPDWMVGRGVKGGRTGIGRDRDVRELVVDVDVMRGDGPGAGDAGGGGACGIAYGILLREARRPVIEGRKKNF